MLGDSKHLPEQRDHAVDASIEDLLFAVVELAVASEAGVLRVLKIDQGCGNGCRDRPPNRRLFLIKCGFAGESKHLRFELAREIAQLDLCLGRQIITDFG